jgi:hypothetical protein
MSITNSQSHQDLFVLFATKKKQNGCFLEIGSNHPITHNNTYILESNYNWKGVMVEYDKSFEDLYKIYRPNSIYELNDARIINYKKILDDNNFPTDMDYLQIDLDVDNRSTLDTFLLLNDAIFDKYKFATITFEHDIYRGNYFDTQMISRQMLTDRGYILVFPNVLVFWEGAYNPYEDWYVHPDLVDMELINKVKTSLSLSSQEIMNIISNVTFGSD